MDGANALTFSALREANRRRLPQFRDRKGRIAHAQPDGSDWSLAEWLQAVVGEVGELANLLKKVRRGDLTIDDARSEVQKELADIAIYLDILSMRCGVDLGAAVRAKFNEVSDRVGASVYIDRVGQVYEAGMAGWRTCAECGWHFHAGHNPCPKCGSTEAVVSTITLPAEAAQ